MKCGNVLISLCIIICILFALSSVCASDVNDTAMVDADEEIELAAAENDLNAIEDDKEMLSASDDVIVTAENDLGKLATNPGNFSDLAKEIGAGGNITLKHDYYAYDKGSTIYIGGDNIVIDGNGAVIDMAGSKNLKVFHVMGSGVTIKNLTIKNSSYNFNGGAIFFDKYGTVDNCNFDNNQVFQSERYSPGNGAAIFFYEGGHVLNSNFTNNRANADDGGAIFCSILSYSIIENCNFIDNYAFGSGGAVYLGSGIIKNCIFVNNMVKTCHGGAIQFYFEGEVINCSFTNNRADKFCGGAIDFNRNSKVTNCNFTNNSAKYGGAIAFEWNNIGTVTNCNFANNSAKYGGAIEFDGQGNVVNSSFTGNNAPIGSAIYFSSASRAKTISNSIFLNNTANPDRLEVTLDETNIEIAFTIRDNLINALYSSGDVSFTNVTYWGASGIENTGDSTITPSRSQKGAGHNIHVIMMVNNTLVLDETKTTDENGTIVLDTLGIGLYNVVASYEDSHSGKIETNETFAITSLELSAYQWTVTATLDPQIDVGTVNFTVTNESGVVKIGEISVKEGVAIFELNGLFAGEYNITAHYYGGINYFSSENNITHVLTSSKNTYSSLKDEIGSEGNVKLKYEYYTYDYSAPVSINGWDRIIDGNGAVIDMAGSDIRALKVMASNVTIRNLTIKNVNFGDSHGGAIYFINSGTVESCTFINNSVEDEGGAVYFDTYGSNGSLFDCSFINNTATSGFGGAAYFLGNGEVKNCKFINNTAKYSGGAVDILYSCNITNCIFTGNKALSTRGGALTTHSAVIENCNFTDNSACEDGGAIMISDAGVISGCNFIANNAASGSAIYFYETSGAVVSNSLFLNNRANVSSIPFEIRKNGNKIEIRFMGQDNLINAIYSDRDVSFTNVTYWGANGIANTGNSPVVLSRSYGEAGQNITVIAVVNDILVLNETKVTDENGTIVLDAVAGNYTIAVCHNEDSYYAQAEASEKFNGTGNETTLILNVSGLTVTATLSPNAVGNVIFTVTNESGIVRTYESSLNDGVCELDLTGLAAGKYNVTATYTGNANYCPSKINMTHEKVLLAPAILIEALNITTDNSEIINITVNGVKDKNITVHVNDDEYNITDGTLILTGLDEGLYNVAVFWSGDIDYKAASNSTWFWAIRNIEYYVNVTPVTSNSRTVNITAKSNIRNDIVQGRLLFNLPNGTEIGANYNDDGTWWAVYAFDNYTTYEIDASYVGLNNVGIAKANITLSKADSTLDVGDIVLDYGSSISVTVTAEGATGITAKINDKPVSVVDNYTIPISALNVGTYTLTVATIADADHNNVTKNVTITVNKLKTQLVANAITATYNINKNLVITLKDVKGNPLIGVSITVDLNGVKTYTTDKNGQVKVATKKLTPKTYTAKITFNGDTNYAKSTKNVKVTVKKAKPKMTAKKKTFKSKTKTKKYTITLKDNAGKAMKKVKVKLKVKGKTYKATTNSKGKAVFKIKKLSKKGKYKATVTYKGNKFYNKVTKKAKITIK